jgi:predicted alpha-1,2-mannosidase
LTSAPGNPGRRRTAGRSPILTLAGGRNRTAPEPQVDAGRWRITGIAEAYVKGLTDFDARDAYARLRAAALDPTLRREQRGGRSGIEPYLSLGYVPSSQGGSVSITTEFANDDFALSQMASALGETKDAEVLLARSRGYRKLFDPETGFLRPRDEKGQLVASGAFDPFFWGKEYVEANAWQSLWMTAHDAEGLVALFGGQEKFVGRLTELFEKAKEELEAIKPDDLVTKSLPRPYYWHANEPDLNAAYLFAQAGRPDLTQKWARWVLSTFYSDKPDGLAGNDDGGTLSAWYVFTALGLYPLPGSDRYIVGAPLFPKVTLTVSGGVFTVEAETPLTGDNRYVQSVELNGAQLLLPEIRHADLKPGGALRFVMGPSPSIWGR